MSAIPTKKLVLFISCALSLFGDAGHTGCGTDYGKRGVGAYASSRHGPDGAILLDPYFIPDLENAAGKVVLDAGCGAAPWAIFAAKQGATVFGVDIQPGMIEMGKSAVQEAGLAENVSLAVGDVGSLPFSEETFDFAMSINVGCNLNAPQLMAHCREICRTLKNGGEAVMTAPSSFEVVFTSGDEVALNPMDREALQKLDPVYRATFVLDQDLLIPVTDAATLFPGQPIWRKLPGLVVPNYYHSEEEYLACFEACGLQLVRIDRPTLKAPVAGLSVSYLKKHPFTIYHLKK